MSAIIYPIRVICVLIFMATPIYIFGVTTKTQWLYFTKLLFKTKN